MFPLPDPGLEGLERSHQPLCYVWRNPLAVLTLDYKAKPTGI